MKVGSVLRFTSDQAVGHDLREKMHVFICQTDDHRALAEYAFLFISSADYGGCFQIKQSDYGFLKWDSYISCGAMVFYSREFLVRARIEPIGEIAATHLVALRNHLADHEVMPIWQTKVACASLPAII